MQDSKMFNCNFLVNYLEKHPGIFDRKETPSPSIQLFHKELYQMEYTSNVDTENDNGIFDGVVYTKEDSTEHIYDGLKDTIIQYVYHDIYKMFGLSLEQFLNLDIPMTRLIVEVASEVLKEKDKVANKAMNDMNKYKQDVKAMQEQTNKKV